MVRIPDIDRELVERCHSLSRAIASDVDTFLEPYSTVSIERTVARLFGIDGVDSCGVPLPNVMVDHLRSKERLEDGISLYLANACIYLGCAPMEAAQKVAFGDLDLTSVPWQGQDACREKAIELASQSLETMAKRRMERHSLLEALPVTEKPWLYVIVATGNIYDDAVQARTAAAQGADVVAVIRSTGQSLLDYVPFGATKEGFGGTYATQENFRIMREALDQESRKLGRYIRLVNYCSGLCMPEIAAMGAVERLDMMLNDAMYGILFRDINARRTLVDQRFSRMINAFAGIIINTGEDNYLTTDDAFNAGPSVLTSQFINYHLARRAGLKDESIGLGHAFEINPQIDDSLSYELAMALLVRQLFPDCPVKYMPPTVHKTGDIFSAHALDSSFNMVSVLTEQSIHLVGMLTEAVHTPLMHDRYLSLNAAKYMRKAAATLNRSLSLNEGSLVSERAADILQKTEVLLEDISRKGLLRAVEEGVFAGIKRPGMGGKGRDGVFEKSPRYENPVEHLLRRHVFGEGREGEERDSRRSSGTSRLPDLEVDGH